MRSSMLKVEKSGNKILAKKPSGTNFILLLTYEILPKYKKNFKKTYRLSILPYNRRHSTLGHFVFNWDQSLRP